MYRTTIEDMRGKLRLLVEEEGFTLFEMSLSASNDFIKDQFSYPLVNRIQRFNI